MEPLKKYIKGVKSGKIPACEEVKQAVARFEKDLTRKDLVYREDKVERVITFISCLTHSTGKHEGKPFNLEGWQVFIIANLYGFYWKKTGLRRFTSSYIEIARKNGKTAFAAALCLYNLIADNEGNAEVLLAANSKEQAKIAFEITSMFSKKLDPKQKTLINYRNEIKFKATESILRVLAADDSKLDGFNASFALIDEYHAAKTSKIRDVMKSSQGMRLQPHICTVTTAGFDKSSPCYQLRTVGKEILQGIKKDDSMFIIIFTLDEKDNWQDPKNWIKSNPNLRVTVRPEYLKEQVQQAINSPSDEVGVRTKNLNQWTSSSNVWLNDNVIIRATKDINLEEFKGKVCFTGVDLSTVTDFSAVSHLFIEENQYNFITKYYLPEDSLNSLQNKELYRNWAKQGFLKLTPGNVVDYDIILNDLLELSKDTLILNVAYDSYNSTQWAIDATSNGLPLQIFSQTKSNFNRPTKEFERLILSGRVTINNNPINQYCFGNVTLNIDSNANSKPDKNSRYKKIDGVISKLMALGGYLTSGNYETKIT